MSTKKRQTSFRRHLMTVVTIGVLSLSITASLFTAWITSKNLSNVLVDAAIQVTQSLANQSVLALLYGSGDNAEDAVRVTMSFPSITHVTILTVEGEVLLSHGVAEPIIDDFKWPESGVAVLSETITQWIFMAPVYIGGDSEADEYDILLLQQEVEKELIGYVVVVKNKRKLREIQVFTAFNNLIVGLLFSLILVYILNQRFKHLTEPLFDLSAVMLSAQQENAKTHPHALLNGPKEVIQIASAYNKLMSVLAERDQQLREQNEHLESEVSLRTQELVNARDMAIEANNNKSHFLANVTHELRTPLQAIIGYSDLVCEALEENMDDIRDDMDSILVNAENLLSLINGVLDLSKVESGKMELNIHPTNLQHLFDQIIDTVKPLCSKNNNELIYDADFSGELVDIDSVKVRQIVLNLLSNAIKFTENGAISLLLNIDDTGLVIVVKDTGIGIPEELQSVVFDAFKQVDGTHTRKYQGTGLGLAISHKFCMMMGGSIKIESSLGKGAIFTLKIPLK